MLIKEINLCTELNMIELAEDPLRLPVMSSSKNAHLSSEQDSLFFLLLIFRVDFPSFRFGQTEANIWQ